MRVFQRKFHSHLWQGLEDRATQRKLNFGTKEYKWPSNSSHSILTDHDRLEHSPSDALADS